jgi:hypothetical protein
MPKSAGPRTPPPGLNLAEHEVLSTRLRHISDELQRVREAIGFSLSTASDGYRECSTALHSLKRLRLALAEELVMSAETGDPAALEVRGLYLGEA